MTWLCILVYRLFKSFGILLTCTMHMHYTTNNFPVQTYEHLHTQEKGPEMYLENVSLQSIFLGHTVLAKNVRILQTCKKRNVPIDLKTMHYILSWSCKLFICPDKEINCGIMCVH